MKAKALLRVLQRDLGYYVVRQTGSHKTMDAPGRPRIRFAFHDGQTIPRGVVQNILCVQVGLDVEAALALL